MQTRLWTHNPISTIGQTTRPPRLKLVSVISAGKKLDRYPYIGILPIEKQITLIRNYQMIGC